MTSVDIIAILNSIGIPYKQGQRQTGHWIFHPISNLKPWSDKERKRLEIGLIRAGLTWSQELVYANWNTYIVDKHKGIRIIEGGKL